MFHIGNQINVCQSLHFIFCTGMRQTWLSVVTFEFITKIVISSDNRWPGWWQLFESFSGDRGSIRQVCFWCKSFKDCHFFLFAMASPGAIPINAKYFLAIWGIVCICVSYSPPTHTRTHTQTHTHVCAHIFPPHPLGWKLEGGVVVRDTNTHTTETSRVNW